MDTTEKQLKELAEIRNLMEKSSRFLSLSGLSGILSGGFAVFGALNVWLYSGIKGVGYSPINEGAEAVIDISFQRFIIINALIVLLLSLVFSWYFSKRKAKKMKVKLWNTASKSMLLNLFIPLVAGGLFCITLFLRQEFYLIVPVMLLFYGLALISAGKYTEYSVNYLGVAELVTGLLAAIFINQSLLFWTLGFGVLHIIYGIVMYYHHKKTW